MFDTSVIPQGRQWDSLNQWLKIVHNVLRRGRPPRGIGSDEYLTLHRDLLHQLGEPSGTDENPDGQLLETLQRSVRPWVHLESLTNCDRRVLRMLEAEVRRIRDQLISHQGRRHPVATRILAAAVVLLTSITILGLYRSEGVLDANLTVPERIDKWWQALLGVKAQLSLTIAQSTMNERLIALLLVMLVVGVLCVRDTKRY